VARKRARKRKSAQYINDSAEGVIGLSPLVEASTLWRLLMAAIERVDPKPRQMNLVCLSEVNYAREKFLLGYSFKLERERSIVQSRDFMNTGAMGFLAGLLIAGTLASAAEHGGNYVPYLEDAFPNQVFFGDTHLHTSYSTDAGLFGNTLGPEEAYRFAKGKVVASSLGVKTRLARPLDFLVISDHSENLGLAPMIVESNPMLMESEWGGKIAALYTAGDLGGAYTMWGSAVADDKDPFAGDTKMQGSMWQRVIEAAEKHNTPGSFTAFIGFEWTSTPDGRNLHRNVIFRDNGDKAGQVLPYSAYDSQDAEDLWDYMGAYQKKTGGQVLAIAHNGNLSNGLMFDDVTFSGKPLDKDYALRRMKAEPLYEVTQIKGDGETHPRLSTRDEFADYGTWDSGSFQQPKEEGMIEREYARQAYLRGLQYEAKLGANPFRFGLIGSSDSHTSLATTTEDNFFGKATPGEPIPGNTRRLEQMVTGFLPDPQGRDYAIYHRSSLASGLAAVWARDNTREAIWDAMARKEVYATTGTRLKIRVFAGWEFEASDLDRPDFARHGYSKGVPMGGDLSAAGKKQAPTFLIQGVKDPDWANLDRIQMIKGWTDGAGKMHERVYDVAVSGNRNIDASGRCMEPVGNTVNIEDASFSNSIGAPMLQAYWKDPDFDPGRRAFYYVRVLEIPTPTWTTFDAAYFETPLPDDVPATLQDRAYTTPVWYTP
jgi:Protein of unknown function (DUF3604)